MPHDPQRLTLAERIEGAIARRLARLPGRLQVWLSGEPAVVMDGQTLDPGFQLLRAVRRRRSPFGLCEPDPAAARVRFRRELAVFNGEKTPVGAVRDLELPGDAGPLRARHYAPPDAADAEPLLILFHGGGFVIGDLETNDDPCRLLCAHARAHVLSVDYRLAPEHPFPAALDDARAALRWAQGHTEVLGADPRRVAVGGDSAGANLAAVVARLAAREGRPPAAQLLIYPVTDVVTARPSQSLFAEGFFLTRRDRDTFSRHYLGGTGVDGTDPRVSPLHATDLGGLPPALVVTASFDLLRDEGEAYAAALQAAGVPARVIRIPGLGHGFVNMTGVSPAARRALVLVAREWRALLDRLAS